MSRSTGKDAVRPGKRPVTRLAPAVTTALVVTTAMVAALDPKIPPFRGD